MNRKISTLFTAGLLMTGSLCGSAWAKQINLPIGTTAIAGDKLTQGQEVFMSVNSLLYGFDEVIKTGAQKGYISPAGFIGASSSTMVEEEDLADYVWTVTWTTGASETSYKLVNKATGETLRIKKNGLDVEYNTAEKAENTISLFLFRDASDNSVAYGKNAAGTVVTPSGLLTAVVSGTDYNLTWNATQASVVLSPVAGDLLFYAVETPNLIDVTELNDLYNGNGFSFGVKTPDTKPLEGNLFGDQRIVARYTSGINVDNSANPTYVSQRIPAGVYFFVGEAPANNSYSAWMNSTVLVASSKETVEATVADREAGQGYSLVAKKIKDLNLYVEDNDPEKEWMSQGDEVSILNACFTVNKTYVGDYSYALTIKDFRYRAKTTEAKHEQKTVCLNVIGHSSSNYLATQALDNPSFIFQLAASGMKDGIELLNKEAKAAVYSIRVMDGTGSDGKKIDKKDVRSAYGKYLTIGEQGGNLNFVAKAKVLVTEKAPAYQWVITEVKNNDVTFTNRETEESFTAKLFPVEGQTDTYELAVNRVNDDNGAGEAAEVRATFVTPIYVNQNTYKETEGSISAKLDKLVIELKPVEVDPYAGFLNVDDKTLVTMAFARDNYETSNKWYAAVNEDLELCADDDPLTINHNYFVNESSEAAQWQLIKKDAKKVVERSFVYNDNGHVVVKAKADVAYAYEYQLQYVNDGEETGYFFYKDDNANKEVDGHEGLVYDNTEKLTAAPKYIIKQNADGSVYLIASNKSVAANVPTIFDEDTKSVVYVEAEEFSKKYYGFYESPSSVYGLPAEDDYTLNTYLIEESPEVSYPAEEGYVYMQSELGDYISMNVNRDGIVVDENPFNLFLHVTDKDAVIPSFYISRGIEGSADRAFLFHPQDSVDYYVADGKYDKKYQWDTDHVKAIFKAGQISESRDTMATMIKGELKNVAVKADDNGTFGGLKNFKFQIVLADDADDMYVVRSLRNGSRYLYAVNDQLTWTLDKDQAMKFTISEGDPTSNESIADAAEGVKVIAGNGIVEIQGAAGKKVIVSNILGKVVAETVLTSDNATIAVPAGIIAVAVDGEAAVKAVVK
ncbi:DUF6383 domain-containing protein [Parabacteroides sp.]